MPNRIIKESIWTSPNLNQLSDLAERHFYRILVLPDDFGCCEVTPLVVKGRCYPLKLSISESDIEAWQQELEDKGLIIRWLGDGRQYAVFCSFAKHQRIRSLHQRKTPIPPLEVLSLLDDTCRQVSADDRPNPNPNPNPKHNHNPRTPLNPPTESPSCSLDELIITKELVLEVYQKEISEPSEDMENEIDLACKRFTPAWVCDAIQEAVKRNRKDWRYIAGILKNWKRYGKDAKNKGSPDKYTKGKYGHMVKR